MTERLATIAPIPAPAVRAATGATYAAFIGSGFAYASWAARIPQVRDELHLDPASLGMVLLSVAAGSMLALPLSGPVVTRFGTSRTVRAMAALLGAALIVVALGSLVGVAPVVVGLLMLGFANGAWDVGMNVQGTLVERGLGRSIMSRFHAGFSLGTVAGALLGALMIMLRVPVAVHLTGIALVVAVAVWWYAGRFLPDGRARGDHETSVAAPVETVGASSGASASADGPARISALAAWREPRTLLVGVFVMAFAFAEGTANDWVSVAAIDGHHVVAALGTLAFAGFLTTMTIGRWYGPRLLDRYGRVMVVRALALVGTVGVAVFVFAPSPATAFPGVLLWGLGSSLGFPVGMSAGGDDPHCAAVRVSVIASIGYCAFLAGPPTVGFLGDRFGVLRTLIVVAVALAIAALVAGSVRPLATKGAGALERR